MDSRYGYSSRFMLKGMTLMLIMEKQCFMTKIKKQRTFRLKLFRKTLCLIINYLLLSVHQLIPSLRQYPFITLFNGDFYLNRFIIVSFNGYNCRSLLSGCQLSFCTYTDHSPVAGLICDRSG